MIVCRQAMSQSQVKRERLKDQNMCTYVYLISLYDLMRKAAEVESLQQSITELEGKVGGS